MLLRSRLVLGECNQHAVLQVDKPLPRKTPRRIVKATRSTKRGQAPSFSAGLEAWRHPPEDACEAGETLFPTYSSIPPQPDFSLLLDFAAVEDQEEFSVPVRSGNKNITKQTILQEHKTFDLFLERMLWQLVKRRWFTALTDFNTTHLFGKMSPPSRFLHFVQVIHHTISAQFHSNEVLAPLWRDKRIRLVLKGGNCISLLKLSALKLLPSVAQHLECIRPSGLSDVDFLLMLHPSTDNFDLVHALLCDQVAVALRTVSDKLMHMRPFSALWEAMADDANLAKQRAATLAASQGLRNDIASMCTTPMPAIDRLVRILDGLISNGGVAIRPELRQDVRLHHHAGGTAVHAKPGRPRRIYVSHNPDIEHRDSRCISTEERCHFSLVRALIGYHVDCDAPNAGHKVSMSKGELIDVSIPKLNDINLQQWASKSDDGEDSNFFFRAATLSAADDDQGPASSAVGAQRAMSIQIALETLDAQLSEQRDLTFGRRMQSVEVWKVAKSVKRLSRLVELLGIKSATLPGVSWTEKTVAWNALAKYLVHNLPSPPFVVRLPPFSGGVCQHRSFAGSTARSSFSPHVCDVASYPPRPPFMSLP